MAWDVPREVGGNQAMVRGLDFILRVVSNIWKGGRGE